MYDESQDPDRLNWDDDFHNPWEEQTNYEDIAELLSAHNRVNLGRTVGEQLKASGEYIINKQDKTGTLNKIYLAEHLVTYWNNNGDKSFAGRYYSKIGFYNANNHNIIIKPFEIAYRTKSFMDKLLEVDGVYSTIPYIEKEGHVSGDGNDIELTKLIIYILDANKMERDYGKILTNDEIKNTPDCLRDTVYPNIPNK